MKLKFLKITNQVNSSFTIRKDIQADYNNYWHYHEEVEIIYFHKGNGLQYVGDHIKHFEPGDLIVLGPNLPHYWKLEKSKLPEKTDNMPFSTVIHFNEKIIGASFFDLPELYTIRILLENAKNGILIKTPDSKRIAKCMEEIYRKKGLSKFLTLLKCLMLTAEEKNITTLSTVGLSYNYPETDQSRIKSIYNYSSDNISKKISLQAVASIVGLAPTAFCRYFKLKTGKTYSQFLINLRINYSCKLLFENKKNIKQIAYESGFNNFSCFYKNFKAITGLTPQNYLNKYNDK